MVELTRFPYADDPNLFAMGKFFPSPPYNLLCDPYRISFNYGKGRLWSIMPVAHSRGLGSYIFIFRRKPRIHFNGSYYSLQHFFINIARAEYGRNFIRKIHDCGLKPDIHPSPVNDHIDFSIEILCHVGRRGGAWSSRCVGAGCRDIATGLFYEDTGHPVAWHPYCHCIKPSRGFIGHKLIFLKYHCKGSRPEFFRQYPGVLRHPLYDFL